MYQLRLLVVGDVKSFCVQILRVPPARAVRHRRSKAWVRYSRDLLYDSSIYEDSTLGGYVNIGYCYTRVYEYEKVLYKYVQTRMFASMIGIRIQATPLLLCCSL